MLKINQIERRLNSDFIANPRAKEYLLDLINGEQDLDELLNFDETLNRLVEFICVYKSEVKEGSLYDVLDLCDIMNPVLDDELSYEKTKQEIMREYSELELTINDFPTKLEDLKSLQTAQEFGFESGNVSYLYSMDELKNIALQNKKYS